jgi:hypothetical protein
MDAYHVQHATPAHSAVLNSISIVAPHSVPKSAVTEKDSHYNATTATTSTVMDVPPIAKFNKAAIAWEGLPIVRTRARNLNQ